MLITFLSKVGIFSFIPIYSAEINKFVFYLYL